MPCRASSTWIVAAVGSLLLLACKDGEGAVADAGAPDASLFGPCQGDTSPTHKLDVLFLVDNSGSTGEEQTALIDAFPAFLAVLRNLPGGLPDLHVGVISSNLGAGGWKINGCAFPDGDDGQLQATPRVDGCHPPAGKPYIADEVAADGTRTTNVAGSIEEAFACIAPLGVLGCGFEQHLASLRRALDPSNTSNSGFLRPDAALAVIILADEDDCSASNGNLFDPTDTALTGTLGPLESFRCTEFGITCAEGDIARAAGDYTACRPRTDSPYLIDPRFAADYLKSIKCDPSKLIVAGIIGNPDPVEVRIVDGHPKLGASCASPAHGTADPAVRLDWMLKQFSGSTIASICQDDFSPALQKVAERIAGAIGP